MNKPIMGGLNRPFAIQRWGDALKHTRLALPQEMTTHQLADRAGVSQSTIKDWEACRELPSAQQLKRLVTMIPRLAGYEYLYQAEIELAKQPERKPKPVPEPKAQARPVSIVPPEPIAKAEVKANPPPAKLVPDKVDDVASAGAAYAKALKGVRAAQLDVEAIERLLAEKRELLAQRQTEADAARVVMEAAVDADEKGTP